MAARPASRRKPYLVSRPAQFAALASPVRQEIVDAVAAAGPCTMAQIAGWLGRPADTLYYHAQALLKVGLLVEAGKARTGRRFGAVYDVPGRPMKLDYAAGSRPISKVIGAAARSGLRDFSDALKRGQARATGPDRNLWAGRVTGWVTPADLTTINRLLAEVSSVLQTGAPRPGAAAHAVTFILAPQQVRGGGVKQGKLRSGRIRGRGVKS